MPAEKPVIPENRYRTSKANDMASGPRAQTPIDQSESIQGGKATSAAIPPQPPQPDPTPYLQQLVTNLSQINLTSGMMTPQQVTQWKQSLQQLVSQGAAAVPAIHDFLERNEDIDFRAIADTRFVGHETLRTALIDALQQIGGSEAIGVALQTIQTTADPTEIAMLAKYLNAQDSGQYRESALTAAREVLTQAETGELGNRDLNAVFEFLQRYGDASVVADLERAAAHWDHYAAMALAGLPDEAGIPALIRLAENTSAENGSSREPALRSLAQVATVSEQAGSALLEQARLGNIQSATWPDIASALAGFSLRYGNSVFPDGAVTRGDTRSFRVSTGNQNYRGVQLSDTLPPAQIQQRIRYIDQLLGATSDPAAVTALYGARSLLVTKATK